MPFTLQIYPGHALAVITFSGAVTAAELIQAWADMRAHPLWQDDFSVLWNAQAMEQLLVCPADIDDLVAFTRTIASQMRRDHRAMVVSRNVEHHIAFLYMLRQKARVLGTELFSDVPEALHWLGVTNPPRELLYADAHT